MVYTCIKYGLNHVRFENLLLNLNDFLKVFILSVTVAKRSLLWIWSMVLILNSMERNETLHLGSGHIGFRYHTVNKIIKSVSIDISSEFVY